MLKKISVLLIGMLFLAGCAKSVMQVTKSYLGPTSTNEEVFYNTIFPPEGKEMGSTEEKAASYKFFKESYERMESYLTSSTEDVMASPEWQTFHDYFITDYRPAVSAYVEYAGGYIADLEAGNDITGYIKQLMEYDNQFIDAHNGFIEILK